MPVSETTTPERRAELAANLAAVTARVDAACAAASRTDRPELLVVTKFHPAADVAALVDLGVTTFGESREPEAGRKVAEVRELRPGATFSADMIGSVQRKKARSVARWARRVQSVDSAALAEALDRAATAARAAGERSGPLGVLLQVSLDGDPARGGIPLGGVRELADDVGDRPGLRLDGLMFIAPLHGGSPADWMARSREIHEDFAAEYPEARVFSAGMSADLDEAIANGSTCVRVGTAILGPRPLPSR